VNHHFQSIIFTAVLLMEETTEAFEWAFQTFVDAMGKAPETILTGTPETYSCFFLSSRITTDVSFFGWS
jgi:hypothetical protein